MSDFPVVVVGAGPVGLAAAAELLERGLTPLVLESGATAGAAVRQWGHVRLFSRWAELVAPAAARLLAPTGWRHPAHADYPTGDDWAQHYLEPLAAVLGKRVRFGETVIGVTRRGRDRIVDAGRDTEPFVVHTRSADGTEHRLLANAVIDASGTWTTPNPAGADGLPAAGERAAADLVTYRGTAPEQLRERHAGRHTVVVGNGHSAFTALIDLAELAEREPGTRVTWVLRRGVTDSTFGGGEADQLPARGRLGQRVKDAVAAGHLTAVPGFRTETIESHGDAVVLIADDGRRLAPAASVVVLTGFRPDLSWLSEVRLNLDPVLQAPVALAPLIDPNVHSCGTVYPHGVAELSHPEPKLFLAGMKSYGRAPTFLAMTGYEQVRSIAAELAGDHESARRVELSLPETGVCGGSGLYDTTAETDEGGCCGDPAGPELLALPAIGARTS
ncbi:MULTISPECIES: NAD(P)-binding domain-containing protein [unclassified Crossiella]|uniref:NAD(P)-binding domain-containing protein n=1 Tax=unclassified Crossiella TaxID=2620835 RepID=UPI001FFFDB24|nr:MULTISPECIES: NAD(P)-binding domain-containing protein [unclassified Crossiella]MCK2244124.1 NAD(P)-binding domain-containing protein [Crossiella sp. S99.2]MCK2257928.1 NAD(P)-binding domain-containing protein [Crossiella sp. S99.1]